MSTYLFKTASENWEIIDALKAYKDEKEVSSESVWSLLIQDLEKLTEKRPFLKNAADAFREKIEWFSENSSNPVIHTSKLADSISKINRVTQNSYFPSTGTPTHSSPTRKRKKGNDDQNNSINITKNKKGYVFHPPTLTPSMSINRPTIDNEDALVAEKTSTPLSTTNNNSTNLISDQLSSPLSSQSQQQQQQQREPSATAPQSPTPTPTALPQFSRHQQKRHAPDANEDAHQRKRSHVMEEGSITATDESVTDTNMVETLAHFLNGSDFSKFHQYRLESHGIIQVGQHIGRQPDVPPSFYDSIALEDKPRAFPISKFSNYLRSTLFSDLYGTRALAPHIFSETQVNDETQFIMWTIFNLSQNIHSLQNKSRLGDSEVSYCHYGLWPLIDVACDTLSGIRCNFKVGETPLIAMKSFPPSLPGYSADGTVFLEDTGLEILLFEASGPFGTRDRRRNTYDHIKGAYGCYAMLHAILTKYPYGDKDLVNDLCVLFLHASGKDDNIRLWVMRPCYHGSVLTFERMDKATITTNRNDKREAIGLIKFFWQVKGMMERSRAAINKLKDSSDANLLMMQDEDMDLKPTLLPSLLTPRPIKPKYDPDYKGIVNLDPVSILF